MSTDCGAMEPKKESSYAKKSDEIEKALAELNEIVNLLTAKLSPVLVQEQTEGENEKQCDTAPFSQLEEYLTSVRKIINSVSRKISKLHERCCL